MTTNLITSEAREAYTGIGEPIHTLEATLTDAERNLLDPEVLNYLHHLPSNSFDFLDEQGKLNAECDRNNGAALFVLHIAHETARKHVAHLVQDITRTAELIQRFATFERFDAMAAPIADIEYYRNETKRLDEICEQIFEDSKKFD